LDKGYWKNDKLEAFDYVENWCIMFWDKEFFTFICAILPFFKDTKLLHFPFGEITMKRVLYM
jgi:hypothetical protein